MLEAKFNNLTEEQKQFLDEQLKKRELKKKAKAEAKLAAQQFEAQQAKQQRLKDARKSEEENEGQNLGLRQDKSLMESIKDVRDKARKACKDQLIQAMKRLDECLLGQPEPISIFETKAFSKDELMEQYYTVLESKIFEKFPSVDANYRRKITDICANIKQIHSYPQIADNFFSISTVKKVSRQVPLTAMITKLYQGALFFRDILNQQQALYDQQHPQKKQ